MTKRRGKTTRRKKRQTTERYGPEGGGIPGVSRPKHGTGPVTRNRPGSTGR